MKSPLKIGSQGIPLTIIETNQYEDWLVEQSEKIRNVLISTCYSGEGLRFIFGDDGVLNQVIFGVVNKSNRFACGDLVNQLPAADYILKGSEAFLEVVAFSWGVGAYKFDRYKKCEKINPILVVPSEIIAIQADRYIQAITRVRDLINTPANDMMPEHLGKAVDVLASEFNADVTQIVGDALEECNYPAIHAVGRASVHPPRLIDLHWGEVSSPKITLVGKGVCFDSGGLNIKPGSGMRLMKKDMGGAAHVVGLAHLIMAYKLPVRLRLLIPAVENAVSGNSFRPGDILTTRSGYSVEIDNTDAEGRLVMCDALSEADSENPDLLIDFATLTGACRVALGTELPGFFSNNSELALDLVEAGESVEDPVWQLPLYKPYRDMLNSDIADLLNCSQQGFGGAITAALYLQKFISSNTDWIHFDTMAWNIRNLPGRPIGGEAFGVRAMFEYLKNRYT